MSWSRRATVLGEIAMPSWANSWAIVVVVRRDQRNPVIGSPAVSCSRRQWRTAIMSGVFFPSEYDTTHASGSTADDILLQKLLSTASHGMHIQAQEVTQQSISAMAPAHGLQPGKQSTLLFIEQAIKEHYGGLKFIGRGLERSGMDGHRNGLSAAPGEHLFAARDGIDGGVEKLAIHLDAGQTLLCDQMGERLLHLGVQLIGQLMGIVAGNRLVHENLYRGQ